MTDTKSPERRTIIKSAAWSLPVIAAAVAAPMAAASTHSSNKSDHILIWNNHTSFVDRSAAEGAISGNVGIKHKWIADNSAVTVTIRVTVNGVEVLNTTFILGQAASKDAIQYKNVVPLDIGKSYAIVYTVMCVDEDGKSVDTYDNRGQLANVVTEYRTPTR